MSIMFNPDEISRIAGKSVHPADAGYRKLHSFQELAIGDILIPRPGFMWDMDKLQDFDEDAFRIVDLAERDTWYIRYEFSSEWISVEDLESELWVKKTQQTEKMVSMMVPETFSEEVLARGGYHRWI